jgi:BA14K-like protein
MQGNAEMLRLRTLAAAALLFAGLTLGFVLGRTSVWLISSAPNDDRPAQAVSERNTTAPAPQAASPAAPPAPTTPAPAQQPAAAASPTVPPVASPAPDSATPGGAPPDPAVARTQEPPKPVVAPNWRAAAGDPTGSASASDAETDRGPRIKLINPSQPNPATGPAEPARKAEVDPIESEADRQGLVACERRYSSFRRSDGTYQPFGGGPRQRCPLLR